MSALILTSSAFAHEHAIPTKYTCEGADVSPPLSWGSVPGGALSLALIVDDPDAPDPAAPKTTWVHWVVVDLPPHAGGLPEHIDAGEMPLGARQGKNDWKRVGYGGPCPPIGRHRYYFKLYALDCTLPQLVSPTKMELEQAMQGHIIAETHLLGTYEKHKK